MTLFFKRKQRKNEITPGFHVLITGVSKYPNLPTQQSDSCCMGQLVTPAQTAYKIYRWLLDKQENLLVPLATIRLLLSPSEDEKLEIYKASQKGELSKLTNQNTPCTLKNFLKAADDWCQDASSHTDNMTFFYFVGHGLQTSNDNSLLLLQDFRGRDGDIGKNSVEINNIHKGMAPSEKHPDIARTQLYFVDACRNRWDECHELNDYNSVNPTPVFSDLKTKLDDRCAPIYFATIPGATAQGIPAQKQTLFSKALLECLDNYAASNEKEDEQGEVQWQVSLDSLKIGLDYCTEKLSQEYNISEQKQQYCSIGGHGLTTDKPFIKLNGIPEADLILKISPQEAFKDTTLEITKLDNSLKEKITAPLLPYPPKVLLQAGFYKISGKFEPPHSRTVESQSKPIKLVPPSDTRTIKVT